MHAFVVYMTCQPEVTTGGMASERREARAYLGTTGDSELNNAATSLKQIIIKNRLQRSSRSVICQQMPPCCKNKELV